MASKQNPNTLKDRKMLILYGSETGNSEECANDVERIARRLHFQTSLEEMNDLKLSDLLQYSLVIFIVSTTGQGELPRNARTFWKALLRKRLPPDCLRRVNFTTFGLGDSSYFQYNWAARKLHKRLEQLGAVEFLPRGEANERHEDGIDGTFLPWCLTLQTYIEKEWTLPPGLEIIPPDAQLTPRFTIELVRQGLAMDASHEDTYAGSAIMTGGTSRPISNSSQPQSPSAYPAIVHQEGTYAERHTEYDIDNHGRKLDREAALFSHVDGSSHDVANLKLEYEVDNRPPFSNNLARLSNATAEHWPGGIDTLDRPNVLRDIPAKYSLDDHDQNSGDSPPPHLLPIPDTWVGMVDDNIRLTPKSHWQDVRRLAIRVDDKKSSKDTLVPLSFNPGDVVVIYPKNFPRDVQALIDLMDWGDVADKPFQHVPRDMDIPCRTPRHCYPLENSTLRDLLTHNYDITCIPRRTLFAEISHYTEDITHKERLREFADPGHSDEFWDYTSRPRRSILEVLQDFPSVRVPYQHVPSVFPTIRGREYSIANDIFPTPQGAGVNNTVVELAVALVKYKTVLRKVRQGLCSRYIESLRAGTPISISVLRTDVPSGVLDPRKPLLAIAPGTGVAPVRALVHRRATIARRLRLEHRADTLLFYGGRNREADFLFKDDWARLSIDVITAFSRDQAFKIYVQDRLLEHFERVCTLLRRGAAVCLCGSSGKMPEAVRGALYDCMVKGGLAATREEAKEKLHREFVFWEEVW